MSKRVQLLDADYDGVSYQSWPDDPKPWHLRGVIETGLSKRIITIHLSREEAEDHVQQLISLLGLNVVAVETGASNEPPG